MSAESSRRYRAANPNAGREYSRRYREANANEVRESARERYESRQAAGLCVRCGAAAGDGQYCPGHEARIQATQRAWWAKRRGRAA